VQKLEELCGFYESSDDGTSQFRLRITRRAVNKLKLLGRDLTDDDVEEHNLRRILGSKFAKKDSNKGLVQKITEIHESGDLDRLKEWRADPRRCAIMELSKVWGIGYRKAQTLIDKNNIWSVKELKEEAEKNPKIVEARVHRTLRCHDDLQLRMSREEALEIGDRVRTCARAVFAELLPLHDVAKLKVEGAPAASPFRRSRVDLASMASTRRRDAVDASCERRHDDAAAARRSHGLLPARPTRLRRRRCVGDARGLAG
jgi:ribosomal protein S13